jgi:hypothetical protein
MRAGKKIHNRKKIEYVTHIRKDVIPCVKPLQSELTMIYAIEQSLIGLKREFQSQKKEEERKGRDNNFAFQPVSQADLCNQILNSVKIKLTSVRIDILSAILAKGGREFTITEIYRKLRRREGISKSAVIATIDLFKTRRLIAESKTGYQGALRKRAGLKQNSGI